MPSVLVIGLGGTGVAAVKELKRMRDSLPEDEQKRLFLLAIDTDKNDLEGLDPEEQVLLDGRPQDLVKWSDIQRFLNLDEESVSAADIAAATGAGGRRALGRAKLFHKAQEVYQKAGGKLRQATSHEVGGDGQVRVAIVASLAGGTGSGTHLDVAYMLRQIAENNPGWSMSVYGFFLLPGFFQDIDNVRDYALGNTYAALLELDYYMDNVDKFRLSSRFAHGGQGRAESISVDNKPYDYVFLADNLTAKGASIGPERQNQAEYLGLTVYDAVVGPSAGNVAAAFINVELPIIKGKRSYYFSTGVARLVYDEGAAAKLGKLVEQETKVEDLLGTPPGEDDPAVKSLSNQIEDLVEGGREVLPRVRRGPSSRNESLSLSRCVREVSKLAGDKEPEPLGIKSQVSKFKEGLGNLLGGDGSPLSTKVAALERASSKLASRIGEVKADLNEKKNKLKREAARFGSELERDRVLRRGAGFAAALLAVVAVISLGVIAAGNYWWREEHLLQIARSVAIFWVMGVSTGLLILLGLTWLWLERSPNCASLRDQRNNYNYLVNSATLLRFLEEANKAVVEALAEQTEKIKEFESKLAALRNSVSDSRNDADFLVYCSPTKEDVERNVADFPRLLTSNPRGRECIRKLAERSTPLLPVSTRKLEASPGIVVRVLSAPFAGKDMVSKTLVEHIRNIDGQPPVLVDGSRFRIPNEVHYLKIQAPVPAFALPNLDAYRSQYVERLDYGGVHIDSGVNYPPLDPISEERVIALKLFARARFFGVVCDCNKKKLREAGSSGCCCLRGRYDRGVCVSKSDGTTVLLGSNIAEAVERIVVDRSLSYAEQEERQELQDEIRKVVEERLGQFKDGLLEGAISVRNDHIGRIADYVNKLRNAAADPSLDEDVARVVRLEALYLRELERELIAYVKKHRWTGVRPLSSTRSVQGASEGSRDSKQSGGDDEAEDGASS